MSAIDQLEIDMKVILIDALATKMPVDEALSKLLKAFSKYVGEHETEQLINN